jgi:hypothetical protein
MTALSTQKDYISLVKDQLDFLGKEIHNESCWVVNHPRQSGMHTMKHGWLKPPFTLVQIVNLNEKRILISAQWGDTMLLVKKANGCFDTSLTNVGALL